MFENVLVGVNGRPSGRDAVVLASSLTDPAGELTLAHVHPGEVHRLHGVTPGRLAEEHEASMKLLEAERSAVDVEAQLVSVVAAAPGTGLHRQAKQRAADLIVVGSCRHGAFGRVMLGDDTRATLNGAPCAVAIAVRGYVEHPKPIKRVGVEYDDSPESKAALAAAQELAASTEATVHALEVISIPTYAHTGLIAATIEEGRDVILSEANARLRQLPDVEGRAVYSLTGEELAAFSDELDVLVVGSHGHRRVRHLELGSTSDYQRRARCSVLVLPRVTGEAAGDAATGERPESETHEGSAA